MLIEGEDGKQKGVNRARKTQEPTKNWSNVNVSTAPGSSIVLHSNFDSLKKFQNPTRIRIKILDLEKFSIFWLFDFFTDLHSKSG